MYELKTKKHRFSYTQIIALSFIGVILVGAFLLCLPISSTTREWPPPLDAVFTATSATCVTGLIVYDTFTHWSLFGQVVILVLIQIGGLGFMTIMSLFAIVTHKHISLHKRRLIMQSTGNIQLGGVLTLVHKIIIGTVIFETAGAIILAFRFCPEMGFGEGLFNAFFHSISAFCNAGFDLMGKYEQFSSFTHFRSDIVVQGVLMLLIIIGGIGFFVWSDILKCGRHVSQYTLHTKMVLSTTFVLVFGGGALFFFLEKDGALAGLPLGEQLMGALFQSVTTRTAGFNNIDQSSLTSGGVLSIVFMLIGGSPGSTAGGIKTTTILVVLLNAIAAIRGRDDSVIFKKRISDDTVRQANAITAIYIMAVIAATIVIMALESVGLEQALFETSSAIGTVGVTMGMTPTTCAASRIILALLMFIGRVGGLSFVLVFSTERANPDIQRPTEKVMVG